MQPHPQPHHSFLAGLHAARQLLLSLKRNKLAQLPPSPPTPPSPAPIPNHPPPLPDLNNHSNQQPFPAPQKEKSLRESLGAQVNQLGEELYDAYLETESYQLIFERLCEHYGNGVGLVEDNERLKRNSYHLQEEIASYKGKIQHNYELIQQHNANTAQMHALAAEHLQQYLSAEKERADITALSPLQPTSPPVQQQPQQQPSEEEPAPGLNLNWKSMLGTVKKAGVKRKAKANQDELRGSFYNSQIYNI